MATLTGEIKTFTDVLGLPQGDGRILEAFVLVGPDMNVDRYDDEDQTTYFQYKPCGTDFLFESNRLCAIFIRINDDPQDQAYGRYPRIGSLIDGLTGFSRSTIREFFGKPPVQTTPTLDRYAIGKQFIAFDFPAEGDGDAWMVSVFPDEPGQ